MDKLSLPIPAERLYLSSTHTLQLAGTAITKPAPSAAALQSKAPKYSILLIDDDQGLRWLHHKALTMYGHDCSEAADGHTGLLAFQKLQPDLIILDIMMPGLDGFAVLEAIRQQNTVVGIIMLSALVTPHGVRCARCEKADSYLNKPAPFSNLLQEIERVGNLVRLRRYNILQNEH